MNRNVMIGGISALVLIIAAGWYMMGQSSPDSSTPVVSDDTNMLPTDTPSGINEGSPSGSADQTMGAVKEFTVTGSGFKFNPATLTVNKGDMVKITFVNSGGSHDFTLDEFDVQTKTLNTGQQETVEFMADTAGSFEYYCSVANHRSMGMKGTLIVQ